MPSSPTPSVPTTPSLEGFNFKGTLQVTDAALLAGQAEFDLNFCVNEPGVSPRCQGFNAGIVSFSLIYLGPSTGGPVASNLFDPILENLPDLYSWSLFASLTETEAIVTLDFFGLYNQFISDGIEIYLTGDDLSESCAFSDRTRHLCRGATGHWVRVPEPPTIAFLALGVIALGFHLRAHKSA